MDQNEQDKAESNVTPNAKVSSPSNENGPISNQQQQLQPPIVQWPYIPQNAMEQFLAMHFPNQAAFNQWQQFLLLQQNQLFSQSTLSCSQPQFSVAGGPSLGANVPTMAVSSTTQTPVPNMCYQYPFPYFPGPWNPSSCLGQLYQMQHPYYTFPGALTSSSVTPSPRMPGGHSFQRGIIRPPATLSQEHQQLWEAQSVENVQLRSVINKLQTELSDSMDRLKKLEEEVSSLKHKVEVPPNKVIGTVPVGTTGQPLKKRGRPKRSWATLDALKESHPRAGDRKLGLTNTQFEIKSPIFEKVILKKVENKEIGIRSTTTTMQRESNEEFSNSVKDVSCNMQINQSNPIMAACRGQVRQGIQAYGSGPALSSTSAANVNSGKDRDKVLKDGMVVSAKYIGNTGNGTSSSGIPYQDVLNVQSYSFFHNGSFIQQGGNITTGLNIANEENDASEGLEDGVVGSVKDENDEEMGDDTSSAAED